MLAPTLFSHRRSLRTATIAVLLGIFSLLAIGQFVSARHTLSSTLEATERRDELLRAQHVQALVSATLEGLKRLSWDESTWDEAYNFVLGRNPTFFDVNLGPEVYDTHDADVIAVLGMDRRVITARAYDKEHRKVVPVAAALTAELPGSVAITRRFDEHKPQGGFVRLGGVSYLFAASPVTHNGAIGPVVGWMIAFRRIDERFEAFMSNFVGSNVRFVTATESRLPVASMPLKSDDVSFDTSSDDRLLSRFVVEELPDGTRLESAIDSDRTVHAAAVHGARLLFISTIVAAILATLIALWFIEKFLIAPLDSISTSLRAIGEHGKLSDRVPEGNPHDEIGTLATSVNAMLSRIQIQEEETQRSRDAALTASRIKSEFVARMSHEIRTPMNGVLGMTELLQRTELNARQRKFCDTILRSANNLLEIVNDILDFSKMEAGRMLLQPSTVPLRNTVEDVVELLAGRAQVKGTEIIVAIDDAVPPDVVLDPLRLNQILTNLIGNAIKFTEAGEIVVGLRRLITAQEPGMLEFSVRDTGIGIAPQAIGGIFESFAQGETTDELRARGTGLGLAIAKQLVELMGGRIDVKSTLGVGSTFTFTIPIDLSGGLPSRVRPSTPLAGQRVLVATENATAAGVIAGMLSARGASARVVGHTGELIQVLDGESAALPDLLLLDQGHANVEVLARLGYLRDGRAGRAIKVVLLSPVHAAGTGSLNDFAHVDAYLTRPVRSALLLATAARLLRLEPEPEPVENESVRSASAGLTRQLRGMRVLVVEDNAVNRDVAVGLLNSLGCESRTVNDGEEALEVLDREGFDVILMDRQMPRRDGISTTLEIRRREANRRAPPTPVIGLTAHAMAGSQELCIKAGMNDFLLKPVALSALSRALLRYAPRRSSEGSSAPVSLRPEPASARPGPSLPAAGAA